MTELATLELGTSTVVLRRAGDSTAAAVLADELAESC
jgi:hypothetical protein